MSQPTKKYDFALNPPSTRRGAGAGETGFPDDWYLMPYQLPGSHAAGKSRRRMFLGAVGVCVCAGLLTWLGLQNQSQTGRAGVRTVENAPSIAAGSTKIRPANAFEQIPAVPLVKRSVTGGQAPPEVASPEDIARLRTRNRRLEALIKVLRRHAPEKKIPADLAAYPGQ